MQEKQKQQVRNTCVYNGHAITPQKESLKGDLTLANMLACYVDYLPPICDDKMSLLLNSDHWCYESYQVLLE